MAMAGNQTTVGPKNLDGVFDSFFEEWFPWLYAASRRKGVDPASAEDMAQEALLALLKQAQTKIIADYEDYLWVVLRNLISRYWRLKKTRQPEESFSEKEIELPTQRGQRDETDESLLALLEDLIHELAEGPPSRVSRGAEYLKAQLDGSSIDVISHDFSVPAGTVKSSTSAARDALRQRLAEVLGG